MNLTKKLLTLISTLLIAGAVQAGQILDTPIIGGRLLVISPANVQARFLGSDAGYFNALYLNTSDAWGPDGAYDSSTVIFNKDTPINTVFDLGKFGAGEELIFRLDVTDTGESFFSGDASRNNGTDGLPHAEAITTVLEDGSYLTTVGFEDVLGGGDLDFNDFMFSLTNVIDPPPPAAVPAPSALFLLGCGLVVLVIFQRKWQFARA